MKIISYKTSFSKKNLRKYRYFSFILFFLTLLGIISWLVGWFYKKQLSFTWNIILLAFSYTVVAILFYYIKPKYLDKVINNFVGNLGEDEVANILEQNLDDSYVYIRNYEIPDKNGDIDGLLISSKEILIIEIKFLAGSFKIEDGVFYKKSKIGFYRTWYNPIKQALKQKGHIENLFRDKGVKIKAIVVFANGHLLDVKGHSGVYALEKERLAEFVKNEISYLSETEQYPISMLTDAILRDESAKISI